MKNREERSKHFFDSGPLVEDNEDIALYDRVRMFYKNYNVYNVNVSVFILHSCLHIGDHICISQSVFFFKMIGTIVGSK